MSPRNLFIAAVAVIAIAIGTWLSINVASTPPSPPQPNVATLLPGGNEMPAFSLLDHTGASIDQTVFSGSWDLVFFGFTHCPDVCPLTLQVLAAAKQQLADNGFQPLPRIVLVSVDPERDTPEQMSQYVAYFGEGNLGITGELDEITRLAKGLGIWFEKSGKGEDYSVDHSAAVLAIDPSGQLRAVFSSPHTVGNFVHDLPIVVSRQ
jgi:protein SCO1/2